MHRFLVTLLALALSCVPALAADSAAAFLRILIDDPSPRAIRDLIVSIGSHEGGEDLPLVARASMLAASTSAVELVELGDRSPLKERVSESVWQRLTDGLPRLRTLEAKLRESVLGSVLSGLAQRDLSGEKLCVGTCNLALAAIATADDKLRRATLVFSAKAMAAVATDDGVKARLLALASDPEASQEARQQAAHLMTLAAASHAQATIAEARLRRELGL